MKRVYPQLILNKIASVFAMTRAYEMLYAIRYYHDPVGTVPTIGSSSEMFNPNVGYTEATNNLSGDLLSYSTEDYYGYNAATVHEGFTTHEAELQGGYLESIYGSTDYTQAQFGFETVEMVAKEQTLSSKLSPEAIYDLQQSFNGQDAKRMLLDLMENSIKQDLDRRGLAIGKRTAITGEGSKGLYTIDMDYSTNTEAGDWTQKRFSYLMSKIVSLSMDVVNSTYKNSANWMVANTKIISALNSLGNMWSGITIEPSGTTGNEVYKGTIKSLGLDVFMDVYSNTHKYNGATYDEILMGYTGKQPGDGGMMVGMYVPLMIIEATSYKDFNQYFAVKVFV